MRFIPVVLPPGVHISNGGCLVNIPVTLNWRKKPVRSGSATHMERYARRIAANKHFERREIPGLRIGACCCAMNCTRGAIHAFIQMIFRQLRTMVHTRKPSVSAASRIRNNYSWRPGHIISGLLSQQ